MLVRPKFRYVRSAKIRGACRTLSCQHCGRRDGTIVAAHSNWAVHGKGGRIKASDIYVAALCFLCHQELDQGTAWTEKQRKLFWWFAHACTVLLLVAQGKWPSKIAPPDVSSVARDAFLGEAP